MLLRLGASVSEAAHGGNREPRRRVGFRRDRNMPDNVLDNEFSLGCAELEVPSEQPCGDVFQVAGGGGPQLRRP